MTTTVSQAKKLIAALGRGVSLRLLKKRALKDLSERELIALESKIGGQLFGEIPKGHRREFFNLDPTTWMWHEEWVDGAKKRHEQTIRYEVQGQDIVKVLPGPRYVALEGTELDNFTIATHIYYERTMREVYGRDPATGHKLG